MKNANGTEVLAVVPLPTAEERRRREIMLARVMLVAIDLVLSGEGMGLETAQDLIREVWHCYPELSAEWDELQAGAQAGHKKANAPKRPDKLC